MSKVLIVDDDKFMSKLISTCLHGGGYEILTAYNGVEGLESALNDEPDVIILDIMMPVMNGLEMLEELRMTSEVPVIMVSAYGGAEEIDKARKLGIECFINKPFKIETLKATIDVVCAMDSELLA